MNRKDFRCVVFSLADEIFPMVFRMLGSKEAAEDAIQEIMIKLWDKRKKIKNHPNIKSLVFSTSRNYCIDLLRKRQIVTDNNLFDNLRIIEEHKELEWLELNNIITTILDKFPQQQKEVLIMRDIDGYEFQEIADAMNIKTEHARVLLSRARKQLSIELKEKYNYERVK